MTPPNRDLVITTPRLTLRATRLSDVPRFTEIESNWNVAKMLRTAPWPVTEANMAAWVATHPQEWVDGTAYRFTILRDEVVIGMCDTGGIVDQWGGFGYWLDEVFWGHGYTKEAASAVLAFARDQVGMKGLKSGHIADNPASGKILRSLGFRQLPQEIRHATPRGEDVPYIPYVLEN